MKFTQALLAAALLAAPASLGVASQTDALDALGIAADEGQAAEGQTLETFEGELAQEITRANLDLRIDRGTVDVVGWEKDSYKIEVLQEADAGSTTGDRETEVTFDETTDGDTVTLETVVDRQGVAGPTANVNGQQVGDDQPDRAIVAHVPARLTYETIHACEGQGYQAPNGSLPVHVGSEDECVPASDASQIGGGIHVNHRSEEGLNITWGVAGLEGDGIDLEVDDGHVELAELDFETIGIETDNGAIEGDNVTVTTLELETDNGQIDLGVDAVEADVETDNGQVDLVGAIESLDAETDNGQVHVESPVLSDGSIVTDNGAIEVALEPTRSGDLTLATDNGAIDAYLAHADDVGYRAQGVSDNGDVQIALVDEQGTDDGLSEEDEYDSGDREVAQTSGYEDKAIQLSIQAESNNGSIDVLEDTASQDDEETDSETGQVGLLN